VDEARLAPALSRPGLAGQGSMACALAGLRRRVADPGLDNDVAMSKVQTPWRRVSQSMITGRAGAGQQMRHHRAPRHAAGSVIDGKWLVHVRSGRG